MPKHGNNSRKIEFQEASTFHVCSQWFFFVFGRRLGSNLEAKTAAKSTILAHEPPKSRAKAAQDPRKIHPRADPVDVDSVWNFGRCWTDLRFFCWFVFSWKRDDGLTAQDVNQYFRVDAWVKFRTFRITIFIIGVPFASACYVCYGQVLFSWSLCTNINEQINNT